MASFLHYRNYGRLFNVYGRSQWKYGSVRKVLNALRTEWAYRRRRDLVRSYPYILFLEPLYYCNLDCPCVEFEREDSAVSGVSEYGGVWNARRAPRSRTL